MKDFEYDFVRRYLGTILIESLTITVGNLHMKTPINPSVRYIMSNILNDDIGIRDIAIRCLKQVRSFTINNVDISVFFDTQSLFWSVIATNSGHRRLEIHVYVLYPFLSHVIYLYRLIERELLVNLNTSAIVSTIDSIVDKAVVYRPYYYISINGKIERFSSYILEKIQTSRVTPSKAVIQAVSERPTVVDKKFRTTKIEDDAYFTYFLIRENLPLYLLFPNLQAINRLKELYGWNQVEVTPIESVQKYGILLRKIAALQKDLSHRRRDAGGGIRTREGIRHGILSRDEVPPV